MGCINSVSAEEWKYNTVTSTVQVQGKASNQECINHPSHEVRAWRQQWLHIVETTEEKKSEKSLLQCVNICSQVIKLYVQLAFKYDRSCRMGLI